MTNNEKIEIFKEYVKAIETPVIKEFVNYVLPRLPEYFWTLPASTTGVHHGEDETLFDHVVACLFVAKNKVCGAQFKNHWSQVKKDQLLAALMLHDGWRCGHPEKESYITQEMIDEKKLDQNLLGNLKSSRDHADVGYQQLNMIAKELHGCIPEELLDILQAVRYHYGPFLKLDKPFSLSWPYDSVIIQCHNIDCMQNWNYGYFTRGNNES